MKVLLDNSLEQFLSQARQFFGAGPVTFSQDGHNFGREQYEVGTQSDDTVVVFRAGLSSVSVPVGIETTFEFGNDTLNVNVHGKLGMTRNFFWR